MSNSYDNFYNSINNTLNMPTAGGYVTPSYTIPLTNPIPNNAAPATISIPNNGYQINGGNGINTTININWTPDPKKFKDKVSAALKRRNERFISEKINKLHTRDKNGKWSSHPKKILLDDLSDKYFCAVGTLSTIPSNPKGVLVFYDGQCLDYDKHYFVEDNFVLFTFVPEGGLDKSLQVLYTIPDLKESSVVSGTFAYSTNCGSYSFIPSITTSSTKSTVFAISV